MLCVKFNRITAFCLIGTFILLLAILYIRSKDTIGFFKEKQTSPKARWYKINPDGEYITYFGCTCVCLLVGRYNLTHIEDYIRNTKVLSRYLSPLPASSYHVTMYGIMTQRNLQQKYRHKSGSSPSLYWGSANKALDSDLMKAQEQCDLVESKMFFYPTKLRLLSYPGQVLTIRGSISNPNEISELRNEINTIFHNMKPLEFHMSLGYIYKEIAHADWVYINENELNGLWKLIQNEYALEHPNIYYFSKITEFKPFNSPRLNK